MRKYRSTQLREGFKIKEIHPDKTSLSDAMAAMLRGVDGEQVWVSKVYLAKHNPQVGGYYLRYPDGYESFCPAESFEAGHEEVVP